MGRGGVEGGRKGAPRKMTRSSSLSFFPGRATATEGHISKPLFFHMERELSRTTCCCNGWPVAHWGGREGGREGG